MAEKSVKEFYEKVYELANYSLELYNQEAYKASQEEGNSPVDKLFKELKEIPGLLEVYQALTKIDI